MPSRLTLATAAIVVALLAACGGTSTPSPTASVNDLVNKGLAAQQAGKTADAIDAYKQVIAIDPGNKFANYNLGLIEELANDTKGAERNYRIALITDPDFVPALFNLAIVRTTPDPWEAVDLYRHIIQIDPKYAAAHLNLGFLLRSLHESDAQAEIDKAVSLDPSLAPKASPSPTPGGSATASPSSTP